MNTFKCQLTSENFRDGVLVETDEIGELVKDDCTGLRDQDLLDPGLERPAHALRDAGEDPVGSRHLVRLVAGLEDQADVLRLAGTDLVQPCQHVTHIPLPNLCQMTLAYTIHIESY